LSYIVEGFVILYLSGQFVFLLNKIIGEALLTSYQ